MAGAATCVALLSCAPAAAKAPAFAPAVKLPGAGGRTEPRIAYTPAGRPFVISNDGDSGLATVYTTGDGGATWTRTPSTFPGQQAPTIDTEIVATGTGRLVATELDAAALTFVTGYSDDGGRRWSPSRGTSLPDIDRPWMAVGPDDPATHRPRVYLLFHNLASGIVEHNMYVMTSTDGGESFGAPVPLTLPGSQAYADLQCADSGAPSSLNVNPRSGQVYAVWGTRTSPVGGCGAAVFGTIEANVVGETRVWVATSGDGSLGSWKESLAADAGDKTVSASFEPAAIDRAGTVYVAYAETANPYPDFSRAAVKYVHAPADLSRWSAPKVVAPAGPVGQYDPSIVAGDGGQLALAYYKGEPREGRTPVWYVHAALVHGATAAAPTVEETRVSPIPAYAQSANDMGGSCSEGPEPGVENGFVCDRATDDWGLGLDPGCRLTVVFPTAGNDAPGSDEGTFASTQTGGGTPCPTTGSSPLVGPTRKELARRIKIAHLHGRAAGLEARWRRRGFVPLRAKTKP
ncbi:MAG TPA: sialidase family protein, partial [Thermoleophilaceae bacterium]